jgi:hypothetical protein
MASAGRRHLQETGMAYDAHFKRAWKIGGALLVAGGACLVHGLFPGLFTDKATRTIVDLNEEVKKAHAHGREPVLLEFEI